MGQPRLNLRRFHLVLTIVQDKTKTTKVKSKANIRNRYNQVPHLTQNTIWENDKTQETSHIREPRAKRSDLYPAGVHKVLVFEQDTFICLDTLSTGSTQKDPPLHNGKIVDRT